MNLECLIVITLVSTYMSSIGNFVECLSLTPRTVDVREHSNVTLSCTNNSQKLKPVRWYLNAKEAAMEITENNECKAALFLTNKKLYSYSCTDNTAFSVTLKRIDRSNNGDEWKCSGNIMDESNLVKIFVKVPTMAASLHPNQSVFTIVENGTLSMQCKSDNCRPEPVFRWYMDNNTNSRADDILLWKHDNHITWNDIIQNYASEFHQKQNRTWNGWYIFCGTSNMGDDINISNKILLNVTYAPDNPPIISELEDAEEYRAIEGSTVNLTCSVAGGNPLPRIEWDRSWSNNMPQTISGRTVTKTISWQASRGDKDVLTCASIHPNKNKTKRVKVKVLFPPDKPTISIMSKSGGYLPVLDTIDVIEHKHFTINCSANSNPSVSIFEWSGLALSNSSLLKVTTEDRSRSAVTCTVTNQMKATKSDVTITGKNSTSLNVNVLYPPSVNMLFGNTTVITEGDNFDYSCNVTNGNPYVTTVSWKWGNETSYGHQLTWHNISRNEAGVYHCCANNTMISSNRTTVFGTHCGHIHLNVEFQAKVLYLIVNAHTTTENLTVNENDTFLNIACEIEGNPLPEGSIMFHGTFDKQNKLVDINTTAKSKETYTNLHLLATLYPKCTDAGQYTCTGWNTFYNGIKTMSTKSLMLHVQCKPRKSPYIEILDRVLSDVNRDVTLSFTALAYPVPPESGYIWSKKTLNGEWTTINVSSNNSKIVIATSGLKSNLTIKNITELDYGLYKLRIENDAGVYQHTFNLTAKDADKKESFQLGLAAIYAIGSVSLLVVMVVAITVYKRRYKGVKQKKTSTCHEAKDEHIYQNVNTEMAEQSEHASKVQNKIEIYRKSLLTKLSPLIGIPAKTEVTNVGEEGDQYANIMELEDFNQINEVDRNSDIQALVQQGNVKVLDHHGDFQATHQHVDSQDPDNHGDFQDQHHFDGLQELEQYDDPEELNVDEPNRAEYGNTLEMVKLIERVHVTELFSYLTGITKDYFETQFTKLPKGLTKNYSFSQKPENVPLNRYHGIYPYDHSRVKIPDIPDFFINACYIDGFESKKAFIACLGPMAITTNNFVMFWQMVWSEKSDVIVMLTMLVEHSGIKCDQYWPNNGTSSSYGDFILSSAEEEIYSDYVIRKLKISKGNEIRTVTHFHFTAWPDKSVPEDVTCLLEFRRRVRKLHLSGPLIVHCSAGIGRTGTLIAIDILIEEGRSQGSVNVLECVKKMREQRVNMVQTLEQYFYIYKTLVNALVFDNDAFPKEDFCKYTDTSKIYNFSAMFQTFNQSVEPECPQENRARTVNTVSRYGNRDGSDIPCDAHRVRLFLSREMSSSYYINAVYVNSYTTANHFIVAQSPLPNGVEDFLSLTYQADCTCVVSMDGVVGGQIAGLYLPPDNSNLTVGNFTVSARRLDTKDSCIMRQFKGAEKVVYHFQYTGWLDGQLVPSYPKKFVEFALNVENCFKQVGNENCHILVHCVNAFERSCVFCAVVALTETVEHEGEVCIPNTLRRIRTRRRRAFPNMEQIRFCFQAVSAFTETDHENDNTYMICY